MFKKTIFFSFIVFSFLNLKAQDITLSPEAEISVLTIGPGISLNDAFGHNGFRVNDRNFEIDLVYGYGAYDFDAPNFYLKFAQGKLNYLISRQDFQDIYAKYSYYNRSIEQQVLNLTLLEKQKFFDYLEINYKPENRKYLYDFFYDNCATRIRDVSENVIGEKLHFNESHITDNKTFRDLIQQNLYWNSWGSLGIDVALGSVIDRKAKPREYMYLPNYIFSAFENATLNTSEKLVKKTTTLYESKHSKKQSVFSISSPIVILSLLSLVILFITFQDKKRNKRTKWLDILLFSFTGLIGIVLLLLWFATDHTATAYNYNLLWAFPLNIFALFQVLKAQPKKWFVKYLKLLIVLLGLLILHWFTGVQAFAFGLLPVFIALLIRYIYLINFYKKEV